MSVSRSIPRAIRRTSDMTSAGDDPSGTSPGLISAKARPSISTGCTSSQTITSRKAGTAARRAVNWP